MLDLIILKKYEDLGISKNELISLNQMLKNPLLFEEK